MGFCCLLLVVDDNNYDVAAAVVVVVVVVVVLVSCPRNWLLFYVVDYCVDHVARGERQTAGRRPWCKRTTYTSVSKSSSRATTS
jgi:hypothetical protein